MVKGSPDLTKFGEGYSTFAKYLTEELYREIDGFMGQFSGKIPEEDYGKIKEAHSTYKSALNSLNKRLKDSVDTIDGMLKKARGAKTGQDAEVINRQINEAYKLTFEASTNLYGLIDPEMDLAGIIKPLYTANVKDEKGRVAINGLARGLFKKGCDILENYFLEDDAVKEIRKRARGAKK